MFCSGARKFYVLRDIASRYNSDYHYEKVIHCVHSSVLVGTNVRASALKQILSFRLYKTRIVMFWEMQLIQTVSLSVCRVRAAPSAPAWQWIRTVWCYTQYNRRQFAVDELKSGRCFDLDGATATNRVAIIYLFPFKITQTMFIGWVFAFGLS